jgi:hypothetical protein
VAGRHRQALPGLSVCRHRRAASLGRSGSAEGREGVR